MQKCAFSEASERKAEIYSKSQLLVLRGWSFRADKEGALPGRSVGMK